MKSVLIVGAGMLGKGFIGEVFDEAENWHVSTQKDLICPDAEVFSSLEEALNSCQPDEHVYIIGGASVYRQALPFAGALCLTEVDAEAPQVDAYFPEVAPTVWQEKSRESHPADEKHPCPYAFVDYIRR